MTDRARPKVTSEWRFREEEARDAFKGVLGTMYEFEGLLGHGGMGNVALARHRGREQRVAIKLLHAELANSDFLSRFRREARTVARIRSKHVARVLDVGELEDGVPYIVMEHLDGIDLADWLTKKGRLPIATAVDFTLQALEAVGDAHASGIVHRDLKPANLFATDDGEGRFVVRVLDFGLAKSVGNRATSMRGLTAPGALLGSPCYMAPEQLLDAQKADARSDVWSMGATLFELLTGEPPFTAPTMPQLYTAIVHGPVRSARDIVPEIPEWLDSVVRRCLSRRPQGRYQDAAQLRDALERKLAATLAESGFERELLVPPSTARRRSDTVAAPGSTREPLDVSVYRMLLESTRAIPWKIDWQSMRFEYVGPQIEMLLGWSTDSWQTAQDWADRIHPDDRQSVVEFCIAQSKAGVDHEAEYRAITKSGEYVWLREVVHVCRDEGGEVECLVGFMFDVTERKANDARAVLRRLAALEAASA